MIDQNTDRKESEQAIEWLESLYERKFHPEFISVGSLDEALRILQEYEGKARLLAGGLDVMGLMKGSIWAPAALINIKPVEKLKYMAATVEGVRIGALTRIQEIERSELIAKRFPMLAEAARLIASPHVRNMASLAGNLCQETRCWYYRRRPDTGNSFACCRKGDAGVCHAKGGENQYHAVMGYDRCVSACPSDMAVALSAMDAKIRTVSPSGGRTIPVEQFYGRLGHTLEKDEIITSIFVPENGPEGIQRFVKFRVRKTIDFAIVSAAVSCTLRDRKIEEARVFLGGVSPAPYRSKRAEELMIGEAVTPALAEKAGEAAASEARPLSKNGYKVQLIKVMVKRALIGE
jgi:xanthine dehydrogenase YagS FAD-binding subunit